MSKHIHVYTACQYCAEFGTPVRHTPVREGDRLDVYVDEHLVEVFVNRGEWTISHAVYGLSEELCLPEGRAASLFTLE